MMTPQEVASHAFARATLGGYNMVMVDEFLDSLTEDYTALYNDNVILKNKLKVLSETVEEYRATDNAMRKTLLAAQQMADSIVDEAEKKKTQLERDAEVSSASRIAELKAAVIAEEYRLRQAQEATAAYVAELAKCHEQQVAFLAGLRNLVPPEAMTPPEPSDEPPEAEEVDEPTSDIGDSLAAQIQSQIKHMQSLSQKQEGRSHPSATPSNSGDSSGDEPGGRRLDSHLDPEITRRFEDLQFGKDYEIT